VPDISLCPAAGGALPLRRWRRSAARLGLAALLTALPLGSATVGAGFAHAVPVTAAIVQPVRVGVAGAATAQHGSALDRGDDRDGDRRHDCRRHGGLVTLLIRLLFGFDRDC
jgi:hypothetical protein